MPFYLISSWTEPQTGISRISVAMNLPSGEESSGFTLRFLDSGLGLEVNVYCSFPMADMCVLHTIF